MLMMMFRMACRSSLGPSGWRKQRREGILGITSLQRGYEVLVDYLNEFNSFSVHACMVFTPDFNFFGLSIFFCF